jgi:hypothetical protein
MRIASRAAALAAALVLLGAAPGCKGDGWTLQDSFDGLIGNIEGLFGASSMPGKYLGTIRDLHEKKSWTFLPEAEEPLQKTCTAVRALATCDYASWGEAALVVEILSSMADEHPSSLVRAEALDTLTRLGSWTLQAVVSSDRVVTDAEMIDSVKVLKSAIGKDDSDPALTFQVTTAVSALAAYKFDRVEPAPESVDNKAAARAHAAKLSTARGALRSINGRMLEGMQGDAGVREALDRAYVSLSASVIRLTLMKASLGDPVDTTRVAALRDLGTLAPEGGGPVLRTVLLGDPFASARREAAKSLAVYPIAIAAPALIDGLADEMTEVRSAAARSLAALSGESFGDDRTAWIRWWQTKRMMALVPEVGR